MQATRLAKAQGADEALLVRPDGIVLEPPTSSIFWVSPRARCARRRSSDGVLDSITRDRLIKALEIEEGAWTLDDLRAASEAFLASTTREIQAVAVDRRRRASRRPRPADPRGPAGLRRDPRPRAASSLTKTQEEQGRWTSTSPTSRS